MDINSGSRILVEPSMFIRNYGNFNSSIGNARDAFNLNVIYHLQYSSNKDAKCNANSKRFVSYRQILDTKYGLKRWQIGEIASKIGQLYYHY